MSYRNISDLGEKLRKTIGNYWKLQETVRNFKKISIGKYGKLQKTKGNNRKLKETVVNYRKLEKQRRLLRKC